MRILIGLERRGGCCLNDLLCFISCWKHLWIVIVSCVSFSDYYTNCEIKFMNMANIHSIRKSYQALRSLCANFPDQKWDFFLFLPALSSVVFSLFKYYSNWHNKNFKSNNHVPTLRKKCVKLKENLFVWIKPMRCLTVCKSYLEVQLTW